MLLKEKKFMTGIVRKTALTGLLVLSLFMDLFSQPSPPGGGGDPGCFPPPCVPINQGVLFLLLAGVIMGAVFLRKDISKFFE